MNLLLVGPPRTGTTYAYGQLSMLLPDHEPLGKDDFYLMDDENWVPTGQRRSPRATRAHIERLNTDGLWIEAGADYLVQERARWVASLLGPTLVVQTVRDPVKRLLSVWSYYRFNKGLIPSTYEADEFLFHALSGQLATGFPVVDDCVADCDYDERLSPWIRDLAGPGQEVAQVATEDLDLALPKLLAEYGLATNGNSDPVGTSAAVPSKRNATSVPRSALLNNATRRLGAAIPTDWPARQWLASTTQRLLNHKANPPVENTEPWMIDIVAQHPSVASGLQAWTRVRSRGGFQIRS